MTRWKREGITVIRTMHEHHRYSMYHDDLIRAAEEMCGNVGVCCYRNSGDGSYSRDWYVSTTALERAGGLKELDRRAFEKQLERWNEREKNGSNDLLE